jgi:hypothetical protein
MMSTDGSTWPDQLPWGRSLQTSRGYGRPAVDALLAGLAEHLAATFGHERPDWVTAPTRFLDPGGSPTVGGASTRWPCATRRRHSVGAA